MSIYTEAEHAIAITDTLYWINQPPIEPLERYRFGRYHYRLKDYNEAFRWFRHAASDGIGQAWFDLGECLRMDLIDCTDTTPEAEDFYSAEFCWHHAWEYYKDGETPEVLYRRAYMLRYGLGTDADVRQAALLFQKIADLYNDLKPEDFDICCNYSYEGSSVSAPTDVCKLPAGAALFELAKLELKRDSDKGRMRLKKAYDFHCEEALFLDFQLFGSNYASYTYQDDIRELFSFRIGQYTRICDVNPSVKAYRRLIDLYESGYPGDDEERRKAFAQKAVPLRKKLEALANI